jgi:hypothetical protein
MALWGKTDNLVGKPKWITRKAYFNDTKVNVSADTINLIESNTGFSTGDQVKYVVGTDSDPIGGLTSGNLYYVRVVGTALISLYDTYAHAIAAPGVTTGRVNLSGVPDGFYSLQRTGEANAYGDHVNNGHTIIFVDEFEAMVTANKARGLVNAGWWSYRTYTDAQSRTRHKAECLVAMRVNPSVSGDASDDAIAADATFSNTDPSNQSVVAGNRATFSITVTSNMSTNDMSFQWQKSDNSGSTWYNIAGASGLSYTTGVLTVADDNGDLYRVEIKVGDSTGVTASAALTVTAS